MTQPISDDLVDKLAEAEYEHDHDSTPGAWYKPWADVPKLIWKEYTYRARAGLKAVIPLLREQWAADLDGGQAGHVVEFRADGWTIQHPLACRPRLFDCPVNRAAEQDLQQPPAVLGRFECSTNDLGDRLFIGDRIDDKDTP